MIRWRNNYVHADRLFTDRVFMIACGDGSKIYWNSITKNGTHYILKKLKLTAENDGYRCLRTPENPYPDTAIGLPEIYPDTAIGEYEDQHKRDIKILPEEKKLVVIRNPIDRTISSYQELVKLREDYGKENSLHVFIPPQYITRQTQFYRLKENLKKSFLIFLKEISDDMYGFYEPHLFSQKKHITDKGWNIDDFEYVIPFDHLGKELEKICNENGIDFIDDKEIKKTDINAGNEEVKRKLKKFCESDTVKDLIHKLYADDFRLYEFAKSRVTS